MYDTNDEVVIPYKIVAVDNNTAEIYFPVTQSGLVTATFGGTINSASYAVTASYALNAGGSPGGSGVGDKIFLWQNFK